uniref:Uncharacterized protein n=1 Tax=mine drainage metagenome TaxID=410659 RepID=E6PCL0_9ZZZZ
MTCRLALIWMAAVVTCAASGGYAVAKSANPMPTPPTPVHARMQSSIATSLTPNAHGQLYSPFSQFVVAYCEAWRTGRAWYSRKYSTDAGCRALLRCRIRGEDGGDLLPDDSRDRHE